MSYELFKRSRLSFEERSIIFIKIEGVTFYDWREILSISRQHFLIIGGVFFKVDLPFFKILVHFFHLRSRFLICWWRFLRYGLLFEDFAQTFSRSRRSIFFKSIVPFFINPTPLNQKSSSLSMIGVTFQVLGRPVKKSKSLKALFLDSAFEVRGGFLQFMTQFFIFVANFLSLSIELTLYQPKTRQPHPLPLYSHSL